ncbi:MAG: hypothetical protein CMG25_04970 [Candidatus Marinimicrobia bacterium]|nr:hypothetical protein [Candidatus Neomarinimicrobiota bacterium]
MINILFIESGISGGGSFESLYQYLRFINRSKINPYIACFNKTKYNKLWNDLDIPIYSIKDRIYSKDLNNYFILKIHSLIYRIKWLPFKFILRIIHYSTIRMIREIIIDNKIEIIYLNNQILRDLVYLIAAESLDVKIISHQRSTRGSGFNEKMAIFANNNVDIFIANSNACQKYWIKNGIEKDIKVAYNFIDEKDFIYQDSKLESDVVNIGVLANFTEAKGHEFLINSFEKLIKDNKNYKLILAGDGPEKEKIQFIVKEKSLQNFVQFKGYIENKVDFLSKIDITVVPSKNESFGRVILESMCSGIPVIATDIGGIPEIISNNINGILVEYGNHEELVSAIIRMRDNNFKREIIVNSKKSIEEKFSKDKYLNNMNLVYDELLK